MRLKNWLTMGAGLAFATAAQAGGKGPDANYDANISFDRVVSLAHVLDTTSPLFPGDPVFTIQIYDTVPVNGYKLEYVHLGTHTGTHMSAPCHFHDGEVCIDQLSNTRYIHPAVVIDARERTKRDQNFLLSWDDILDFEHKTGKKIPPNAIVILWTGFGPLYEAPVGPGVFDDYFDNQPGFAQDTVQRLADPVSKGGRGVSALGSDTFGPDATIDTNFSATSTMLNNGGVTVENMANLEKLHTTGDWVVFTPARLINGSGYQTNVLGLVKGGDDD